MKKILLLVLAVCCAATFFSACSDDDDENNENGKGPGNGGSGVTVLPKKVAMIIVDHGTETLDTTFLSYDAEGKLVKMIYSDDETVFSYSDDHLTLFFRRNGAEENSQVYRLKSGRVSGYQETYGQYTDDYTFSYDNDYLSGIEYVSKTSAYTDESEISTFTMKDGNLESVKQEYREGDQQEGDPDITTIQFEYGHVANNANVDLGSLVYSDEELGGLMLLGVAGKRYQNLPAKMTETEFEKGQEYTETRTFNYEVKDDYVVGIQVTKKYSASSHTSEYKYVIVYE